jgi:hypothetical protein
VRTVNDRVEHQGSYCRQWQPFDLSLFLAFENQGCPRISGIALFTLTQCKMATLAKPFDFQRFSDRGRRMDEALDLQKVDEPHSAEKAAEKGFR